MTKRKKITGAPPIIITENTITVVLNNKSHSIHRDNVNFADIRKAIRDQNWDALPELINPVLRVQAFTKGHMTFKDGVFTYMGMVLNNVLTDRMLKMMAQGFPVDSMVNFLNNLLENPSKQAVDELFLFMQTNNLPLTEDGCFIAYKKVRNDYKDIHSGTMDNSVGKTLSMPRFAVDDNRNNTCSAGLHFCSVSYLPHFGNNHDSRVVILKINPRDVVSIPSDYKNAKGRTCRYEVIGEYDVATNNHQYKEYTDKAVVSGKAVKQKRDKNGRFGKRG